MIYDKIICQKCIIERRLFEAVVLPQRPQPIHQWKHRDLRVHIHRLIVVYGPLLSTAAAVSTTSFPSSSQLGRAFLATADDNDMRPVCRLIWHVGSKLTTTSRLGDMSAKCWRLFQLSKLASSWILRRVSCSRRTYHSIDFYMAYLLLGVERPPWLMCEM